MAKPSRLFLIGTFVIGLGASYLFADFVNSRYILPLYQQSFQNEASLSVFNDTDFDFIVLDPADFQLEEMDVQSSIDGIFPYHLGTASISKGTEQFDTYAAFSSYTSLEISQYNEARTLQSLTVQPSQAIYVDQIVANNIGASLGDSVTLNLDGIDLNLVFTVSKIFIQDTLYLNNLNTNDIPGSVYFPYVQDVKTLIETEVGRVLPWSAVMVDSNNVSATETYFDDYIPYGRMLTREFFGTDLEFNNYVEEFESRDYSQDVSKKSDLLETRLAITNQVDSFESLKSTNLSFVSMATLYYFLGFGLIILIVAFIMSRSWGKFNSGTFYRNLLGLISLPIAIVVYGTYFYGYSLMTNTFDVPSSFNEAAFLAYWNPSVWLICSVFGFYLVLSLATKNQNKLSPSLQNQKLETPKPVQDNLDKTKTKPLNNQTTNSPQQNNPISSTNLNRNEKAKRK
jgi:hypothetical protein